MPIFGCASDEQYFDELNDVKVLSGNVLPSNPKYKKIALDALTGNLPERESKSYSDYIKEHFCGI